MYIHRVTAVDELCFIIATYIGIRNDRLAYTVYVHTPRTGRLVLLEVGSLGELCFIIAT